MTSHRGFSCFVIGEGSLLLQCGEQILGNGNELRGVISRDPTVRQWAEDNGLPWTDPRSDLRAFLGVAPFDYLFSITNPTVLSSEVLRLPRRLAVNYHDALLPRYGGTYATSWALLGREKEHGITWHVMAERVDQGDILKQVQLEVEPGETALSLNFKCYEAALEAFTELLDELATGRLSRTPQDISRRSFFPRSRRPRAACTISWQQSAEEIDALFRALDFGNYLNPLGLPRLLLGGRFYIAQECEVLPSQSTAPAGTLTGVEPDGLKVSTSSTELVIRRLLTNAGEPLSIPELLGALELRPGSRLPEVPPELASRSTEVHQGLSRHEEFWVEQLGASAPAVLPCGTGRRSRAGGSQRRAQEETPLTERLDLLSALPEGPAGDLLLTAFLLYLARGNTQPFDVGLSTKALQQQLAGLEDLFSPVVPLRVPGGASVAFDALHRALRDQVARLAAHQTFAQDIFLRHPSLRRSKPPAALAERLPVVVQRVPSLAEHQGSPDALLCLAIPDDGSAGRWTYDADALTREDIQRMARELSELARSLFAAPDQQSR